MIPPVSPLSMSLPPLLLTVCLLAWKPRLECSVQLIALSTMLLELCMRPCKHAVLHLIGLLCSSCHALQNTFCCMKPSFTKHVWADCNTCIAMYWSSNARRRVDDRKEVKCSASLHVCAQVRIESDPKEWPAMAAQLAAQRAQREAIQASVRKVR